MIAFVLAGTCRVKKRDGMKSATGSSASYRRFAMIACGISYAAINA